MKSPKSIRLAKPCPCHSGNNYTACCEVYHQTKPAPTAEALMRSRYSAYALGLTQYLLSTWHPRTRPANVDLSEDGTINWLGLQIIHSEDTSATTAIVEFIARYKVGGNKAERLHEASLFELTDAWYYVSGDIK